MKNLLTEKFSKKLLATGILLLIVGLILFLWNDFNFSIKNKIQSDKIAQFGDFVGGLIGSIWALAGVILFYVALSEQRKDFSTNREVLTAQTDALKQQIKEFELQREELYETRKVFKKQSETLKTQQFESTLFNLINLHHSIVDSIDLVDYEFPKGASMSDQVLGKNQIRITTTGRDCFSVFSTTYNQIFIELKSHFTSYSEMELINSAYSQFYEKHQTDLGHYFRNLYHIFKFIDNSEINEKSKYSSLVRAQLSNYELVIVFYNSLTNYGNLKFKPLIEKYNILKNINIETLIDEEKHIEYYDSLKKR